MPVFSSLSFESPELWRFALRLLGCPFTSTGVSSQPRTGLQFGLILAIFVCCKIIKSTSETLFQRTAELAQLQKAVSSTTKQTRNWRHQNPPFLLWVTLLITFFSQSNSWLNLSVGQCTVQWPVLSCTVQDNCTVQCNWNGYINYHHHLEKIWYDFRAIRLKTNQHDILN